MRRDDRKAFGQAVTLLLGFLAIAACGVVLHPAKAQSGGRTLDRESTVFIRQAAAERRQDFSVVPTVALERTLRLAGAIDNGHEALKPELIVLPRRDHVGAALYGEIATLMWNSGPVSAGALYLAATSPAQRAEPAWRALGTVFSGMFGDGIARESDSRKDLDEMRVTREQAAKATRAMSKLDPRIAAYGRLVVLGTLWSDPVALRAGELGLSKSNTKPADLALIHSLTDQATLALRRASQRPGRYLPSPISG